MTKLKRRLIRKKRIRATIAGTAKRPRVSVFRSNKNLYVQFIDDVKGVTLLSGSDAKITEKNKMTRATTLGKELAEKAKEKKIVTVVFDRSGYAYHGRVQALATGLREGGVQF